MIEKNKHTKHKPSSAQKRYLRLGLGQAGGKLPLFDENGQRIDPRTINSCLTQGWCEPWFKNPIKPDWRVCRLTDAGRKVAAIGKKNRLSESTENGR